MSSVSFNVSYDPQAQKQEIERILNQDKSFLNSMNMTLEKSFLDEHEPPTHTRLEKHPKYKKYALFIIPCYLSVSTLKDY